MDLVSLTPAVTPDEGNFPHPPPYFNNNNNNNYYTKLELTALRAAGRRTDHPLPPVELRRKPRGCRAGAKLRARSRERKIRFKPAVPSVVMGNVNSLTNKTDELAALVKNQKIYRECSLICLTETWLSSCIPDANVELPGFTMVRADRDAKQCGKRKGGGLALFINNRWCNQGHVTVKETICCRDIELLAVGLRPYYIPREFSHAIAVCVYIPPRANADAARDAIHNTVARLQSQHPEAFYVISGDFNHVTLEATLTGFYQFVDCPTRKNRTIDLLYANTKEAYSATPLPPLGKSDHNLVYLQPQYKPLVASFRKWSPEAEDMLRDCMATTTWEVMQESFGDDVEGISACTTDYWNWCRDNVVPVRTVRCFPNNKPWITCDVKALLNKKKRAFKDKDQVELRRVQGELKTCLREAKESYGKKVERKLQQNNMREVWEGMKTITGCKKKKDSTAEGSVESANEFNHFFNRFADPAQAPTLDCPAVIPPPPSTATLPSPSLSSPITAAEVSKELRRLRPRKAAGPDGVCPRLLKACAAELGEPLQHIYNLSLRLGRVPTLWKTSCIIPVPKKGRPSALNDYRPVALTSHAMKTLERLILRRLMPQVQHALDPLQFAYQEKVGVEDAVIYLLHRVYSHLDKGSGAVRIMFFDFSSAFNTILPPILKEKLDGMAVDPDLVAWITDYLTDRPQYVRTGGCTSDTVISSTGAPQGTCLAPALFTLYTSDFRHNSESCHMQKYADDSAIVAFTGDGQQEEEYRDLVASFTDWCRSNNLQLNISKTKEIVLDFRRTKPPVQPVSIEGTDVEVVRTYKYLGIELDDKLDWTTYTDTLYRKGQSRLYFLRRLKSFNICNKLLRMFYQSVVASVVFYAVVCWGGNIRKKDAARLDKLVRRAGSVVGERLDDLVTVQERRSLDKLLSIMDNTSHPLHTIIVGQRSLFSGRLLSQGCSTDRLRRSFVPRAIRLFNTSHGGRRTGESLV